jgi:hypothetical protein
MAPANDGRMKILVPVGCVAVWVVSAGCGSGSAAADRAIAALVPRDAVVFVRLSSLDDLVAAARACAEPFGAPAELLSADQVLSQLGPMAGDTALIDRRRPLAFALVAPRAVPPSPVLFVPARDAAKYAASLAAVGTQPTVQEGYVALPLAGKYEKPAAPSPFCEAMPDGLVAVRIDVAKAAANLGTVIGGGLMAFKSMLGQLPVDASGVDPAAVADLYISAAQAILRGGETFELTADVAGGQVALKSRLVAKPGSELDGWSSPPVDVAPCAAVLTGRGAIDLVAAFDWKALRPQLEPALDALLDLYPPDVRAAMRSMMQGYEGLYDTIGPVVAAAASFAPDGRIGVLGQLAPPDPSAWLTAIDGLVGQPWLAAAGITIAPQASGGATGAAVRDFRVTVDPQRLARSTTSSGWDLVGKMLGADGVPVRFAAKDRRVAFGLGPRTGDVVASLGADGGAWPKALRPALAFVRDCNPMFAERIDVAALSSYMAAMNPLLAGMLAPPAGAAADIVAALGIRGAEWRAMLSIDLAGFAELVAPARRR